MSNALVINGANFYDNRVEHITYDVIHAESIVLSSDEIEAGAIGQTYALTYTVTPADAEDSILWTSSNSNVATISEDGVVTIVGCGSCTITATAGTVSDTCDVTVEIVLTDYGKYSNTMAYPANDVNDLTGLNTYYIGHDYYGALLCGVATDPTETQLLVDYAMTTSTSASATIKPVGERPRSYTNIGWCVPIALPSNCTKIRVTSLDATFKAIAMFYKKDVPSQYCGGYVASRQLTSWYGSSSTTNWPWVVGASAEFDIPEGYDSIVIDWRLNEETSPFDAFYKATEEQLAAFTITAC